jgi:hypothetical protein
VYALQLVGKQLSSGLEFGLSYQFTFRPQLKVVSENVEQDDTASTVQQSTNVPQRTKQLCRLLWFMLFLLLCLLGFLIFWLRFLRFLWFLLFGLCIFPQSFELALSQKVAVANRLIVDAIIEIKVLRTAGPIFRRQHIF